MANTALKKLCLTKAAVDDAEIHVEIDFVEQDAQVEDPSQNEVLEKSGSGMDHSGKVWTENEGRTRERSNLGKVVNIRRFRKVKVAKGQMTRLRTMFMIQSLRLTTRRWIDFCIKIS
ncbi:hypothetical protein SESBI_25568 [Sesbania bispinosa]|nr:hypothetical protein SESBI_25568 [Sesbania bispinosa]